jgi:DNA transposition AAA+ family ATPase
MKNLHEQFSSVDLLNYLFTKLGFLFSAQQYVITVLQEALKRSRMVGILGREGMGKSSAIAKFIQDNPQVYYLRIGTTYTISNFFNEMLFQVSGVYPTVNDTLFTKMKMLSHLLTKDNTKKLIVVDDSGRLSPKSLSVFFELRDNCIQTTGFVFVGLDYFQKNLLNAKKNGVAGIAEFYRRVENWYGMKGLLENEIPAYGLANNLTEDQVLQLKESGVETIAELENMTLALLEEAEDAKKEERAPKKVKVPGKTVQTDFSRAPKSSKKAEEDEEEDDELEEAIALKKKEAAKKAREAKKAKEKIIAKAKKENATKHAASV